MSRSILLVLIAYSLVAEARTSDLSFVSCWPKSQQSNPVSRSIESQILTSPSHWRAYAIVTANASNGSCHNTTRLYVASPGHDFAPVFTRSVAGTEDGNGIRLVGWSRDGKRLLAELTDWAYGSDAPLGRAVLIYDSEHAAQTLELDKSLGEHLGSSCLFDYSVVGWKSQSTILLQVRPFSEALDARPSCVSRPTAFAYQIETHVMRPI